MTLARLPQQELHLAPFDLIISIILQDLVPWGHHFVFQIHLLSSITVDDPFPLLHTTLWNDQSTVCPLSSLWTSGFFRVGATAQHCLGHHMHVSMPASGVRLHMGSLSVSNH